MLKSSIVTFKFEYNAKTKRAKLKLFTPLIIVLTTGTRR